MTAAHIPRRGRPSPDLTGRRFARYIVVERAPQFDHRARWRCRCDCGTVKAVLAQSLLDGTIKSCGCLRAERCRENGRRNEGRKRPIKSYGNIGRVTMAHLQSGGRAASNTKARSKALATIFRPPPDTVHVDRPGARIVRGGRY